MSATKAVREIENFVSQFKNLIELSDKIGEVGSIEKLISAQRTALADLKMRADACKQMWADCESECALMREKAQVEAEKVLQSARGLVADAEAEVSRSAEIRRQADADANRVVAEAAANAEAIVQKAKVEAEKIAGVTSQARKQLDGLEAVIAAKTKQKNDVLAAISKYRKTLDDAVE